MWVHSLHVILNRPITSTSALYRAILNEMAVAATSHKPYPQLLADLVRHTAQAHRAGDDFARVIQALYDESQGSAASSAASQLMQLLDTFEASHRETALMWAALRLLVGVLSSVEQRRVLDALHTLPDEALTSPDRLLHGLQPLVRDTLSLSPSELRQWRQALQ